MVSSLSVKCTGGQVLTHVLKGFPHGGLKGALGNTLVEEHQQASVVFLLEQGTAGTAVNAKHLKSALRGFIADNLFGLLCGHVLHGVLGGGIK